MRYFIHTAGGPTRRLAGRLRTARPGSILILVVALLVLMALIGTAWLTTARIDRHSSQQNSYNTQIDLLLQAAVNLAKSEIADDVYAFGAHRPRPIGGVPMSYEHYEAPEDDAFMASRVPVLDTGGNPYWPYVSGAPGGSAFETPYADDGAGNPLSGLPWRTGVRQEAYLTSVDITNTNGVVTTHPAFQFPGSANRYLAADTDGDGQPDALLVRMPVGNLQGVTYYMAMRVVDNNSAINASIAWNRGGATPPPAANLFFPTNVDLQTLLEDSAAPTAAEQMAGLNAWRFTVDRGDDTQQPPPTTPTADVPDADAFNDDGTLRTDISFWLHGEAPWMQMGRRLGNPGYNDGPFLNRKYQAVPVNESLTLGYRFLLRNPFASRSMLEDTTYRLGMSIYDRPLPAPNDKVRKEPYALSDLALWYNENFAFDYPGLTPVPPQASLRSILVARNAVSTLAPNRFNLRGNWQAGQTYEVGDWVKVTSGGVTRSFVCVRRNVDTAPGSSALIDLFWAPMPWTAHPTKSNINTAGYPELLASFTAVMDERVPGGTTVSAPYPEPAPADLTASLSTTPRERRQFRSPLRDPTYSTDMDAVPSADAVQLPPAEVARLRAGLAAVNTIDLRDADFDISFRKLVLQARVPVTGGTVLEEVDVSVYGNEPQPFITEIYVNNYNLPAPMGATGEIIENAQGYVAVELHNPYPFPIQMNNWNLGLIDRRRVPLGPAPAAPAPTPVAPTPPDNNPYPDMLMQTLTAFVGFGNPGPVIPAEGYLILENYAGAGDTAAPGAATYRPVSSGLTPATGDIAGVNRFYVANLEEVLREPASTTQHGGELVLLRPRRYDGQLSYDDRPTDQTRFAFDERNSTFTDPLVRRQALAELIPLDSFDFTEMWRAVGTDFRVWHYVRENGVGTPQHWKCVYPGRWDPGTPWNPATDNDIYRQEDTDFADWNPTGADPWEATPPVPGIALGAADVASSYHNPFPAIQLNNLDMPGPEATRDATPPNPVTTSMPAGGWQWPYGGFARNGDILQVPFIGAYRVRQVGDVAGEFLEMNSITTDSTYAHDADSIYPGTDSDNNGAVVSDDIDEMVGRFCPMEHAPHDLATSAATIQDFDDTPGVQHRYAWAIDLFDHFAVETPQDDYLPNVDPGRSEGMGYGTVPIPALGAEPYKYPGDPTTPGAEVPQPIANGPKTDPADANNGREDGVGVEGLININTAPLAVLQAVPMLEDRLENLQLANAIIEHRDNHGPFKSLFELNNVYDENDASFANVNRLSRKGFRNAWNPLFFDAAAPDPDEAQGDLSPGGSGTVDGVRQDFEERFLMLTRVSNFLTTRSDTFTVYVEVQGWSGVGSNEPEQVVRRRAAFIADRNLLNQDIRGVTSVNISTE